MGAERADQGLADRTTINPRFLGISDNSWQRTKLGVSSSEYTGGQKLLVKGFLRQQRNWIWSGLSDSVYRQTAVNPITGSTLTRGQA